MALLLCLVLFSEIALGQILPSNNTGPLSTFQSRPDIFAPFLNISMHDDGRISPGYIFLAPYQTEQPAPYIYDHQGNLVWSGWGQVGAGAMYHNFHVCSYQSSPHLCVFEGHQYVGYSRGQVVILDDNFHTVSSVVSQGSNVANDMHESNLVDNGRSALVTIYRPQQYDLSTYGITGGQGWIMNTAFQEIGIDTNRLLFEWNPLDHIDPSFSLVLPDSTESSGTGLLPSNPWDYFHINSVDKFSNGDYLISARHTSAVYRISSTNGSVVWSLGGKRPSISLPQSANFSAQHDARIRDENDTTTTISIFDNASNGYNQTSSYSSGKIIVIDHTANRASLLQTYIAPLDQISASQGNLQILPNTNVYIGWGENAYISEYTKDGEMVMQGHFATTGAMHYRSFKFNFTSNPSDAPAAYVYAPNTTEAANTTWYISWNGATEARQWRISTSSNSNGPWKDLTTTQKVGFETIYSTQGFYPYSMISALGADGTELRNTSSFQTFVPSSRMVGVCSENQCGAATGYAFKPTMIPLQGQEQDAGQTSSAPSLSSTPISSSTPSADAKRSTGNGKFDTMYIAKIQILCILLSVAVTWVLGYG